MVIRNAYELKKAVDRTVDDVKVTDIHTHLFSAEFGNLLLWGVDELVTYHYLVAETMRRLDIPYSSFWSMTKAGQADLVWDTLFISNSPISEACRGVLTVLERLGLDVEGRNLDEYRSFFRAMTVEQYIEKVFDVSGVKEVIMTNDPFDDAERAVWLAGYRKDPRFRPALRIDPLINLWSSNFRKLKEWGYDTDGELNDRTLSEIRRFLADWIDRMSPVYMAASLPPTFRVPEESAGSRIIEECILPVSREKNVPFAMMIGVKRQVNPGLQGAADSVGKSDIGTVEYLCSKYPHNKFLVTMLARENQHELCIAARKFRNLLIFGCWWFLNNPSLIEEITRMRFELLGSGFIPQHSDSRVLDQLIYKWAHSRRIISKVLFEKYSDILDTGWVLSEAEIRRDVEKLFGGNLRDFLEMQF